MGGRDDIAHETPRVIQVGTGMGRGALVKRAAEGGSGGQRYVTNGIPHLFDCLCTQTQ